MTSSLSAVILVFGEHRPLHSMGTHWSQLSYCVSLNFRAIFGWKASASGALISRIKFRVGLPVTDELCV